ncbi:Pimeloyl-ACP methyl ester carboxylesterase [Catalinimonas alkaloidigena]|uniref:Proline iminopeptidase n=1 Tax=Catalinimonas alkaloidigena TaxID=1075417 RepID=A0A1G9QQS3_9BACT|nr:alpha/beta hydrolase [Catalinimonas alkaloidigena]SDM13369.1 Pimeloyl-ACP methyl ester carboxylesterase [Catalinimonas alkaloidigena]
MTKHVLGWVLLLIGAVGKLAAQANAIDEAQFIRIGGIEQWVTIRGSDRSKPAILFLHGGPGSTMSPYEDAGYGPWQNDFVLVQWDQRGAGRTFGRNAPEAVTEEYWLENPLTVAQLVADGIELSEYLLSHLGKPKLILMATSWGTVLGARMALARPDLFAAYIGHAQIVNPSAALVQAYQHVLERAQRSNDVQQVERLKALGPPPYDDARNVGQLLRVIKTYEQAQATPTPASWWTLAPEYDNAQDAEDRQNGDDYSFLYFAGHKKMGIASMVADLNFLQEDARYALPVYLIQGEHDLLTPKELTQAYFDRLEAPKKELILLPDAAHGPTPSVLEAQYRIARQL